MPATRVRKRDDDDDDEPDRPDKRGPGISQYNCCKQIDKIIKNGGDEDAVNDIFKIIRARYCNCPDAFRSGGGVQRHNQKGGAGRITIDDPIFINLFTVLICCLRYLYTIPILAFRILYAALNVAIIAATFGISYVAFAAFAKFVSYIGCSGGAAACATACVGATAMAPSSITVGVSLSVLLLGTAAGIRYTKSGNDMYKLLFKAISEGYGPTTDQEIAAAARLDATFTNLKSFFNEMFNDMDALSAMSHRCARKILECLCEKMEKIKEKLEQGAPPATTPEMQRFYNLVFIMTFLNPNSTFIDVRTDCGQGMTVCDDVDISEEVSKVLTHLVEQVQKPEVDAAIDHLKESYNFDRLPVNSAEARSMAKRNKEKLAAIEVARVLESMSKPPSGGSASRRRKSSRRTSRKPRNKRKTIRKNVSKTRKRTLNKKSKKRSKRLRR
tara:strand:- start:553 stop:1878 length:1326 start_codon:yes stop_codon:yes gene_type:complete